MNEGITIDLGSEEEYNELFNDSDRYRKAVTDFFEKYPQVKPDWFDDGFYLHRIVSNKKYPVRVRQLKPKRPGAPCVTIRPSFILPYNVMRTDIAKVIFKLSISGASYEEIAEAIDELDIKGHVPKITPDKVTRIIKRFGHANLVKTTVKDPSKLSKSITVDEKHTKSGGEKAYIAMAAASGILLGATVLASCSAGALSHGYSHIAEELNQLPGYDVESVTSDGFGSTQIAIAEAFPDAEAYRCFFHSVLPLRKRFSTNPCFNEAHSKLWELYSATNSRERGQRKRRLVEYAEKSTVKGLKEILLKACARIEQFAYPFENEVAKRTTNEVDRLMRPIAKWLSQRGNLRGAREADISLVKGIALILNFRNYTLRTRRKEPEKISPFHELNGYAMSDNWLENLLINLAA